MKVTPLTTDVCYFDCILGQLCSTMVETERERQDRGSWKFEGLVRERINKSAVDSFSLILPGDEKYINTKVHLPYLICVEDKPLLMRDKSPHLICVDVH